MPGAVFIFGSRAAAVVYGAGEGDGAAAAGVLAAGVIVAVAGGPGRHNLVIPTTGDLTECVTRPITFKDGTPIRSVKDFVR